MPVEVDRDPVPRCTRKDRSVPVRYGVGRPLVTAMTGNVSTTGVFVRTASPLKPGTAVVMRLELGTCTLPLRGIVAWSRSEAEEGDPGMGVNLVRPPALYAHFVGKLP